ncbi:copper resistance protein B [Lysobacter humi (ex Lee et al. 2017)]
MKTLLAPLATALLAATPLAPVHAQHTGHEHHAMPAKPAPKKAVPKPKQVARPAAAPGAKAAAKAPAATRRSPPRAAARPAARPAPAAVGHAAMGHGSAPTKVDHAAMGHGPAVAPAPPVDHAAMGHGAADAASRSPATGPAGIDHAAMGHNASTTGAGAATGHAATDHSGMDHAAMGHTPDAVDHAAMGHGGDRDLPADAAPRTPIPALTDADRAAAFPQLAHGHAVHDRRIHSYWLADRLEWQDGDEATFGWEGLAWVGGDLDRLWLRTEGEAADAAIEHGDVEVLYGRSVSAWWDVVAGMRQDFGHGPSRTWAAVGVQGLAPYKFEVEATAYVGSGGRTAATVEAEYDTLITPRLILQWQAEASLYGRDDPAAGIGSGLSTVEAGARLRYEITRRFAPYVGVQVERAFGGTAELRRDDGAPTRDTRLVAGIRFWF